MSAQMVGPTTVNTGQPHRFTSPYHSVQAAPMLVNPNPQVVVNCVYIELSSCVVSL